MASQRATRMQRELTMLQSPPPGITVWTEGDNIYRLSAVIRGLIGSPYADGLFKLDIQIPPRFPFEPPCIQFITPIYHPNIDDHGRICLDVLKMPPKGSWKPSIHLSGVLNSIRMLMLEPNPDDPLSENIASEFKMDHALFTSKAKESTKRHASGSGFSTPAIVSESLKNSISHAPDDTKSCPNPQQGNASQNNTFSDASLEIKSSSEPETVVNCPSLSKSLVLNTAESNCTTLTKDSSIATVSNFKENTDSCLAKRSFKSLKAAKVRKIPVGQASDVVNKRARNSNE